MQADTIAARLAILDLRSSRRARALGALSGFAFGAVLAAIPLATNIVTFGLFGTLSLAAVECTVIAVAFAALAAALSEKFEANISRRA